MTVSPQPVRCDRTHESPWLPWPTARAPRLICISAPVCKSRYSRIFVGEAYQAPAKNEYTRSDAPGSICTARKTHEAATTLAGWWVHGVGNLCCSLGGCRSYRGLHAEGMEACFARYFAVAVDLYACILYKVAMIIRLFIQCGVCKQVQSAING